MLNKKTTKIVALSEGIMNAVVKNDPNDQMTYQLEYLINTNTNNG